MKPGDIGYEWGKHGDSIVFVRAIRERSGRIGMGFECNPITSADLRKAGYIPVVERDNALVVLKRVATSLDEGADVAAAYFGMKMYARAEYERLSGLHINGGLALKQPPQLRRRSRKKFNG